MTESTRIKPCFSTLHEEWLLKYGQVLERAGHDASLLGEMVASRIGLSGALQCGEMNAQDKDVEAVQALLEKTLLRIDQDAGTFDISSMEATIKMEPVNVSQSDEEADAIDADGFFEMYPECVRAEWDEEGSESDDDDEKIIEEHRARADKKQQTLVPGPPSSQNFLPDNNSELANASAGPNHNSTVNSIEQRNPYQKAPMPSLPRTKNPYHAALPIAPACVNVSAKYNNEFSGQMKSTSWNEHRNQHNLFQTAREYDDAGGGEHDENYQRQQNQQKQCGQNRSRFDRHQDHSSQDQRLPPRQPQKQLEPEQARPANIPDSLKRKFQLPTKRGAIDCKNDSNKKQGAGGIVGMRPTSSGSNSGGEELPEELKGLDKELIEKIQNEIMESGETITFDDIAGLEDAKQTVQELVCWPMKRPDLFTGLRRGPNGLLLFGPPGTGKTLIGKAIAYESGATFFSISSSSLTSKWIGEGEKLVRTLFAVAAYREPAVVFIDEIDSLLTQRKADENEASRRIKTEFLVQLDGTGTSGRGRVLVIGATNRPHELDDAARRRFVKRLYIPLPARSDREILLRSLLIKNNNILSDEDFTNLSNESDGFSGADLKALCVDAAMGPLRELGAKALEIEPNDIPPIAYKHFRRALRGTKASVAPAELAIYIEWNSTYGSRRTNVDDDSEDDGGSTN